jgi:hypothetical protein
MAMPTKSRAAEGVRVTLSFSDSINLVNHQIDWSPKGVSLLTKWPFQVGAEVEFAFDHLNERHCCAGIVVSCRPLAQPLGFFETVLFFVETELQKAACDCRLTKEQNRETNDKSQGHSSPRGRVAHSRR